METFLEKYRVRPGTVDQGKEYEVRVAALLSLRCVLHDSDDSWIGSNVDEVGAFDDVILHLGGTTYMVQIKHKEKPKPVTRQEFFAPKGDFSLKKYLEDSKMAKQFKQRNAENRSTDICFAIFTNRKVNNAFEFFKPIDVSEGSSLPLLETNRDFENINKLDYTHPQLTNLVSDVPGNIYLFSNQVGNKHITECIEGEIKNIADYFGLTPVNTKTIAESFTKFVTNWAQGNLGGHYYLRKQDVISKLAELFICQYEANFKNEQFHYYETPSEMLWNEIGCDKSVTVVNSSRTTMAFLQKYIASEVRNFFTEAARTWSDEIDNVFYQRHPRLKNQMLKVVGNYGKITVSDVYKCLWIQGELPLIVMVKKLQDYDDIIGICRLSRCSFKVLLVNELAEPLPREENDAVASFETLGDLNEEQRNKILELPVKMQGRNFVQLKNIIDESLHEYIKCSDIISILSSDFNIGNQLPPLPEYHISRSVSRVFLRLQVLQKVSSDIFLIEEESATKLETLPVRNLNFYRLQDVDFNHVLKCNVIAVPRSDHLKIAERLKETGKNVHYLSVHDSEHLEWKRTFGSINSIKKFRIEIAFSPECDITKKFCVSTTILNAPPGMGKSVLMDFAAQQVPVSKWVLRVDLNGHQQYYRNRNCRNQNTTALEHLKYFNNALLSTHKKCNVELTEAVFLKLASAKDLVVLLDGFDEVSVSFKEEAVNIAKCLQREGYVIWITTRPFMKSYLEEQLNAFSISLYPFTIEDQTKFLTKYFKTTNVSLITNCSTSLIDKYVGKLLEAARNNLNDVNGEFTRVPFQTKLLGEVFNDDCGKCLRSGTVIGFNDKFDLLILYEHFIDKKLDILCERFGGGAQDMSQTFKEHQSLFALKLLFPLDEYVNESFDKMYDYYKDDLKKIMLLQREGVITVDENFNIKFIHRIFAELLVAEWLIHNCNSTGEKLRRTVESIIKLKFTQNYRFLFGVFEQLVTRNCTLHMAINSGKTEVAKTIIRSNASTVNDVDSTKRSAVHLIALKGVQFPVVDEDASSRFEDLCFFQSRKFKTDKMLELLKTIPGDTIALSNKTDKMGFTPLEYALKNRSLAIANELSLKLGAVKITADIPLKYKSQYLNYCIFLQYKSLFKLLLSYFAAFDILLKKTGTNKFVKSYVQECLIGRKGRRSDDNFSKCVGEFEGVTLMQLLCSEYGRTYSGYADNNFSDLRFAAILSSKENVDIVCKRNEVNKEDLQFGNTALHYAALHGNLESVEILLGNDAKVNAENQNGDTPLHLALMNGHVESATVLTDNGGDVNKTNKNDDCVIHYAVQKGDQNFVVKSIDRGADINKSNFDDNSSLHLALAADQVETAKLLISKGALVDKPNRNNQTALHCACAKGHHEIVSILLRSRNEPKYIDMKDNNGYTPLHLAALNGYKAVVELLLNNNASHKAENNRGETAFHCAAKHGFKDIMSLFVSKDALMNEQNVDAKTALHLSVMPGNITAVKLSLDNGTSVNINSKQDNTPLFVAIKYAAGCTADLSKWISLIDLLLDKGSDLSSQHVNGNTPLHYLSAVEDFNSRPKENILLLLDRGVLIDVQNNTKQTALDLA